MALGPGKSVERNQAAHTLRSLTHPKLPVAKTATGQNMREGTDVFLSLTPTFFCGVGGTAADTVRRGSSCPIHLCPESAALVMTPLHLHGLNSHPSNFSRSVDLVKMKTKIRNWPLTSGMQYSPTHCFQSKAAMPAMNLRT